MSSFHHCKERGNMDSIKTKQFKFKGISLTRDKKKFRAVVKLGKRRFDLGIFNTEIQAITAYNKTKRKYERLFNEI